METLNQIISWVLGILTAGTIVIILISLLQAQLDAENRETYIKKIKNAIIFLVIALAVFQIKNLVFSYFGSPHFQTY
ncbi:MAG: hypothetical protein IKF97_06775 [Clostridia bacterium]|nr:hypothetical protein [Clostridia bacterium]